MCVAPNRKRPERAAPGLGVSQYGVVRDLDFQRGQNLAKERRGVKE
jgi:hypothetical protein